MAKLIDRIGQRFERLVVLERVENLGNQTAYKCKCDCGNECVVRGTPLAKGKVKSCGCYNIDMVRSKFNPEQTFWNEIFAKMIWGAKKRGLSFELTLEQVKQLCLQPCHYCGTRPQEDKILFNKRKLGAKNFKQEDYQRYLFKRNGIDRIDSSKGYTIENCIPCCKICNKAKLDYSYEYFMKWVEQLVKFRRE